MGRKRPPLPELASAMSMAKEELQNGRLSPIVSTVPIGAKAHAKLTSPPSPSSSPIPTSGSVSISTSAPAVRMYQDGTSTTYVNGTAAYTGLPTSKTFVSATGTTSAARAESTAQSSSSTNSKAGIPSTQSTAKRSVTTSNSQSQSDSSSSNAMIISHPTTTYTTTSTSSAAAKLPASSRATAATTQNSKQTVPLAHPQAVHRVPMLISTSNTTTHPSSSAPPRATAKTSNKSTNTASRTSKQVGANAAGLLFANSSARAQTPDCASVDSDAGSVTSSRAPSPVRSAVQVTKIGNDPFKVTEEFNAYRGTASVGHATIAKPSALSWSGSRSSASVDSLTVISSLKQRTIEGTSITKPIARKHFIGMQNLGNTCYINSAIQCLASAFSFSQPLTSMLVSLEDVFRNNGNPLIPGNTQKNSNSKNSNARSSAATSSRSTNSVETETANGRASRRRRGANGANSSNNTLSPAPAPPPIDKKTRSRKSWIKYPDAPPHNPEDAKFNPLIASLVSILKTLSHPEHLIQLRDSSVNVQSFNRLSVVNPKASILELAFAAHNGLNNGKNSSLSSSNSSSDRSRSHSQKNSHGNHHVHGIQQQLIANSDDEEMDVDPIGVDEEEEEVSSSTKSSFSSSPSPSSSSASSTSSDLDFVPSQDVTKVLQAFQNSSGQLLDEKYYTDQHQDISEFMLHLLEYTHDQLNTKKPLPSAPAPTVTTPTPAVQTPVKKGRGASASSASQGTASQTKSNGRESAKKAEILDSPRTIAHTADYPNLSRLEMDCKEWYHYMATNQSPVTNSFDGLLRRSRKCPKGHTATSYEIFRILTLHFEDENAKECTLEDMFRTLRKPEVLECRCSACGGNDDKTFSQVTDVYILPKYLIITLGRFKGSSSDQSWWAHKIKTRVKFPLDNLDMAPLFDIAVGQPSPRYNLVAISNHKGSSIHGGHYFSYVRSWANSEHWVVLNDTTVKEVRTDAIVSNQAYMLFYERQDK